MPDYKGAREFWLDYYYLAEKRRREVRGQRCFWRRRGESRDRRYHTSADVETGPVESDMRVIAWTRGQSKRWEFQGHSKVSFS